MKFLYYKNPHKTRLQMGCWLTDNSVDYYCPWELSCIWKVLNDPLWTVAGAWCIFKVNWRRINWALTSKDIWRSSTEKEMKETNINLWSCKILIIMTTSLHSRYLCGILKLFDLWSCLLQYFLNLTLNTARLLTYIILQHTQKNFQSRTSCSLNWWK